MDDFLSTLIKSRDPSISWERWKDKPDQEMSGEGEDQAMKVEAGYPVNLTTRRNCVVYLNEIL